VRKMDWQGLVWMTFLVGSNVFVWALLIGWLVTRARRVPINRAIMFAATIAIVAMVATVAINLGPVHHSQQQLARERELALPFTGLHGPRGAAVDAAGNVYVADSGNNRLLKLAAGSNTQTVLPFTGLKLSNGTVSFVGFHSSAAVAADAAGNVYVADTGNKRVLKLATGSSTQTVLPFIDLAFPSGVAVDTAGSVYVADPGRDQAKYDRVVKLAAGSSTPTVLPATGFGTPDSLAVDTGGNVYTIVYVNNSRKAPTSYLLKLAPGSDTWTTLASPAGLEPYVAVDTAGNVYAIEGGVKKMAPGSSNWTELPEVSGFVAPSGLAVDSRGNVYVTDRLTRDLGEVGQGVVVKLPAG
jgi:sugar lactone lactonase YvrE